MILSEFSEIIRQISKIDWVNSEIFSPIHIIYIRILDILENVMNEFIIRHDGIMYLHMY